MGRFFCLKKQPHEKPSLLIKIEIWTKRKDKEVARKVKMKKVFWFGSDGVSMGHTEIYEFPQEKEAPPNLLVNKR